jgi:hypothetical protein
MGGAEYPRELSGRWRLRRRGLRRQWRRGGRLWGRRRWSRGRFGAAGGLTEPNGDRRRVRLGLRLWLGGLWRSPRDRWGIDLGYGRAALSTGGDENVREPTRRRGGRRRLRRWDDLIEPLPERIEVEDHARDDHRGAIDALDGQHALACVCRETVEPREHRRTVGSAQLIEPMDHDGPSRRLLLGDEAPYRPLVQGLQDSVF